MKKEVENPVEKEIKKDIISSINSGGNSGGNSDSITRRQLEELMMSLSFNIHTDEDIQFLNQLYANNQADMYIFRLTNTKKYFESIIIPYCKEHWKEIIKIITNENIKKEFILNFREIE